MAFWVEETERSLQSLREQAREFRRLRDTSEALPGRIEALQSELSGLEAAAKRARKWADRLSKGGFWALPQRLTGRQVDAAAQAEQAAREADLALAHARQELDDAARELPYAQKRLAELDGCEAQFASLLEQKAERLRAMDRSVTENLELLEFQRDRAEYQAQALKAALAGGKDAIPLLTRFAQRMDDLRGGLNYSAPPIFGKETKWAQAGQALRALREPLRAYCAPDFPCPVSRELETACIRWYNRAIEFMEQPYGDSISMFAIEERMTQAENLREYIRATFPQLEVAVAESAESAARTARRWEDFVCDTPAHKHK